MTQYFTLSNSTGKDIGKNYPQTNGMGGLYPFGAENSISNLPNLQIPTFIPNLDYFNIHQNAKLTDFISTGLMSVRGFLVSEKTKGLLEQFNIDKHKFYQGKIFYREKFYTNYYWLHFGNDMITQIDFKHSQFITKNQPPWDTENWDYKITPIEVNDLEHLNNIKSKYAGSFTVIEPSKLYLKACCIKDLDLFFISAIQDGVVFITEKLKNTLSDKKISGIEVVNTPYPIELI